MITGGTSWLKALPFKIIVLAAAYFLIGILTSAIEASPNILPAVWLPAGIALAATLVWGYKVWPGILLGAFATQIAFHMGATDGGSLLKTLTISALIGSGAVLQSAVGAYLILRFAEFPRPFVRIRDGYTLLLGGPVSCLVSSVISGTAVWLAGSVPPLTLIGQWGNWWLADTLGVLTILPLFSVWLDEQSISRSISLNPTPATSLRWASIWPQTLNASPPSIVRVTPAS